MEFDGLKLGKLPARQGAYKLKFADFLKKYKLPPLPKRFGYYGLVHDWGMYANDQYGDCVWAGAAHETKLYNAIARKEVLFTDGDVLADYGACTGFSPFDHKTDKGTDMQAAAEYRRTTGIMDASGKRHKIAAYLSLDPGNIEHLFLACYLFNAVGVGIVVTKTTMQQFVQGKVWTSVPTSDLNDPLGGHYVPLVGGIMEMNQLHFVSWGQEHPATPDFLGQCCDEAVAYVSEEALVHKKSADGFDYEALIGYLNDMK